MKKNILIVMLALVATIANSQIWDYDHSRSTILYGGSVPAPATQPYSMGELDKLVFYVGINLSQGGDMCGVNWANTSICLNTTNSGCATPPGFAGMNVTIVNSDTFKIEISATAAGDMYLNVNPEFYMGCSIPMGWPPSSNKKISIVPGSLPIELSSQSAQQIEKTQNVLFNWVVATQLNNDFFTVETSQDGVEWKETATVSGAGTTTNEMSYSVEIKNLPAGYAYIRLKQTDFDGNYAYSPTLSVYVEEVGEKTEFFVSETFDGRIFLSGKNLWNSPANNHQINLMSMQGQMFSLGSVSLDQIQSGFELEGDLPTGVYAVLVGQEYIGKAVKR